MAFSLQSCTSPRERSIKKWEKTKWSVAKTDKKEEPTWVIYTRKLAGTNFVEYKIEGEIKSSPKDCISSFKDEIYSLANDPKNKKYPTYKIMQESEDSLLTYVIHKEPFPLKDTEMSVRYLFSQDLESAAERVEWKEAWDVASVPPASKRLSRVETFRGTWSFLSTPDNSSKAANSVQFDPKKMPLWLVKPMVVKFLVDGLEGLREMASKRK